MGAVLKLLGGVPFWAWALAALAAWGGWHRYNAISVKRDFEHEKVAAAAERAASAAEAQAESSRRLKAVQEAADAAQLKAKENRDAADRARRAHDGVLERISALQADSRPADPAVADKCKAAIEASDMLADVLRRADARAGELAAYADAAATAGAACERAYDSLTKRGPNP